MKVEIIKDTPKKQFIPFALSIRIETPEELMELYHRMNNNQLSPNYKRSLEKKEYSDIGIGYNLGEPNHFLSTASTPIFEILQAKVRDSGLQD
jgi:hypothetical protein